VRKIGTKVATIGVGIWLVLQLLESLLGVRGVLGVTKENLHTYLI